MEKMVVSWVLTYDFNKMSCDLNGIILKFSLLHWDRFCMCVFEIQVSITNTGTHKYFTMPTKEQNGRKIKTLKHTHNVQFRLIIIKYFTVVCRLRPIQTNVVTVFYIFIFRFIVSLCVRESDAGLGVCKCMFLLVCMH